MALEFNSQQEQVSSLFTAYRNDIDIYTEDQYRDKPFYKRIFKRLLDGTGIRVNDVYPLGSSDDVITACIADKDTSRKKLYIVDGDIYLLYNPKVPIKNLFILNAYCMENMVIDEKAVCETLFNFLGEYELEDIKRIFDFNRFIDDHKDKLMDLFYHMAIQSKYCGYFELRSYAHFYRKPEFKPTLVDDRIKSIKREILSSKKITEEEFEQELINISKAFPKTIDNCLKIISGKDYLIYMIQCHATNKFNKNLGYTKYAWKFNFANFCELSRLSPLKNVIIKTAQ